MRLSILIYTGLVLACSGCASSSGSAEAYSAQETPDGVELPLRAAIFVEGKERGATPGIVRIRRSFDEMVVSLRQRGQIVQTYVIEQANSYNRNEVVYSFRPGSMIGRMTLDVAHLNTSPDGAIMIPYFRDTIEVTDRRYDLTLIIER